jgi:hypothetical protein
VRKSFSSPAALVVNDEQAAVVRSIFDMFGNGNFGLVNIARFLEKSGISTRLGRFSWDTGQVKSMLKKRDVCGSAIL